MPNSFAWTSPYQGCWIDRYYRVNGVDLYGKKLVRERDFRQALARVEELPELVIFGNFIADRAGILHLCRQYQINTVHGEDGFFPHCQTLHADLLASINPTSATHHPPRPPSNSRSSSRRSSATARKRRLRIVAAGSPWRRAISRGAAASADSRGRLEFLYSQSVWDWQKSQFEQQLMCRAAFRFTARSQSAFARTRAAAVRVAQKLGLLRQVTIGASPTEARYWIRGGCQGIVNQGIGVP